MIYSRVIHSITFGHGKTKVLATARCILDLMMFVYISLLNSVLISSYSKTWNPLSWYAWNNEFQVKMTFLSTRHSVSIKIHIPCFFVGSSTIFLFLFNIEFDAIFLLKHKRGHKIIIFFHQKQNHLQKTKLEFFFTKTLYFSLKIMQMSRVGDLKWDLKRDLSDWKYPQ